MSAKKEPEETPVAHVRRGIHPMLAWPAIYALAVFVAAWMYHFTGRAAFSPWFLLAALPVLGIAGGAISRAVWDEARYGHRQGDDGASLAWATAVATAGWLTWSGHVGPDRAWSVWALVVGVLCLWWWALGLRAPKRAAAAVALTDRLESAAVDREWREILDQAGAGDVQITGRTEHRAGFTFRCEPDPEAKKMPTYDDFAGSVPRIAVRAASRARRRGAPLPMGAVRTEPGADDAEFLLHVTTRDVFAAATEFVPDYSAGDITKALDVGEYEDAARILMDLLAGHWKIVGASNSGKSTLANNIIARASACANALVWVAATDKLIPLVFPWVRSFFDGSAVLPALDWVAGTSPDRVRRLLRAAYRLACERNDRLADDAKMKATAREPAVIVVLEESSHAVEFTDTIRTHDGQDVTVSDLLKMIAQAGRSANVRIVLLSQYGINAGLGDRASELMRNLTGRVCLRTMEDYDGMRTLPALPGSVRTTELTNYTMYLQPSIDVPRASPGKAAFLEGTAMIAPIATRNAGWRPGGVEQESAVELGPDYAHRWERAAHPELGRAVERAGLEWRVPGVEPVPAGPAVGVAVAPIAAGEEGQVALTGDDGGTIVDTTQSWTDEDDAAFRELLPPPEKPRPFQLPDLGPGIARLKRHFDPDRPVAPKPSEEPEDGDDDGPAEVLDYPAGNPLPEPLAAVVEWLELMSRTAGHVPEWVRTEEAAVAIGWGAEASGKLGRALARQGLESDHLPRGIDPQRRRGYPVSLVHEVAQRHRFGL